MLEILFLKLSVFLERFMSYWERDLSNIVFLKQKNTLAKFCGCKIIETNASTNHKVCTKRTWERGSSKVTTIKGNIVFLITITTMLRGFSWDSDEILTNFIIPAGELAAGRRLISRPKFWPDFPRLGQIWAPIWVTFLRSHRCDFGKKAYLTKGCTI